MFTLALVFSGGFGYAQTVDHDSSPIISLKDYVSTAALRLPSRFEVLVWNIQKAGSPKMIVDFQYLAQRSELVLFQEAIDSKSWVPLLVQAKPEFGWKLAQSFRSDWNGYSTGVATGSRVVPERLKAVLSRNREPFAQTPKSILASEYSVEGISTTLLVANIHAINFREQGAFEAHVEQLVELLQGHDGPLLVAGDFNTWNPLRMSFLRESLGRLALQEVPLKRRGFLELDHASTGALVRSHFAGVGAVHSEPCGLVQA